MDDDSQVQKEQIENFSTFLRNFGISKIWFFIRMKINYIRTIITFI